MTELAGGLLTDDLTGVDPHEHSDVEVYAEAEEWHDVPAVSRTMRLTLEI